MPAVLTPKPLLGIGVGGAIEICAWCPEKDVLTDIVRRSCVLFTHGICEAHKEQVIAGTYQPQKKFSCVSRENSAPVARAETAETAQEIGGKL